MEGVRTFNMNLRFGRHVDFDICFEELWFVVIVHDDTTLLAILVCARLLMRAHIEPRLECYGFLGHIHDS